MRFSACAALLLAGLATADTPDRVDFARDVRPILEARCVSCHGPKRQRGDLRLDRRAAAMQGGQSGRAIVPGKPDDSPLLKRVITVEKDQRMPPSGETLSAAQVKTLRDWIAQGANWPDAGGPDERLTHWAFQPLKRPTVPARGGRTAIDAFLADALANKGLAANAEAGRTTLIRRLRFGLLGLPPTPEEVRDFVADRRPDAYERLADRYLASPHFGERWGRHWLDVVRFAETTGFETNAARPTAWPYRDYVIRALNEDRPYDRFARDQIAGDAGGEDVATGFLVGGAYDQVKGDPALNAQQRADELHDMVSTTAAAFLGVTAGCARCHNHKFDPISQVDYYGLKAVFEGVQHGERTIAPSGDQSMLRRDIARLDEELDRLETAATVRRPVNARRNVERFAAVEAKFVRLTILATNDGTQPCIDELEVYAGGRNVALASGGAKATASGTYPGSAIHKLHHVHDGRHGNSWSWISDTPGRGWVQIELPGTARIDRIVWGRDREGVFADRLATRYRFEVAQRPGEWQTVASSDDRPRYGSPYQPGDEAKRLLARKTALEGRLRASTLVYAGRFTAPPPTHRLHRGEVAQPRERVAPSGLASFGPPLKLAAETPEQARRAALARWISDARNPLFARVVVNRLWHHHFGTGIVATPSDLGLNGARPSHPELLDWLASELIDSGWSLKHVHRLIVRSDAYRRDSAANEKAMAADAGNRLLWRYPRRRLEAEPLRDTILAVSGKLDTNLGGPGFDLFEPKGNTSQGVKVYVPRSTFGPAEWRRMVYQTKPRMRLDDTFGAFDCPDAGQTSPTRTSSTTPLQVLNLLNSPFAVQQAGLFADRLRAEERELPAQVRRGYWLAFQREPSAEEVEAGVEVARDHGLAAFCRAVLNANEVLYVD